VWLEPVIRPGNEAGVVGAGRSAGVPRGLTAGAPRAVGGRSRFQLMAPDDGGLSVPVCCPGSGLTSRRFGATTYQPYSRASREASHRRSSGDFRRRKGRAREPRPKPGLVRAGVDLP
jgi:hypothetical protein